MNYKGSLSLTNCTISGNSTAGSGSIYGGGLNAIGGTTTLTNCTISNNSATVDGGIYHNSAGTFDIGSSIVAENTATTAPDVDGTFVSDGYNLIGVTYGSTGWTGSDLTGTVAGPLDTAYDTGKPELAVPASGRDP